MTFKSIERFLAIAAALAAITSAIIATKDQIQTSQQPPAQITQCPTN